MKTAALGKTKDLSNTFLVSEQLASMTGNIVLGIYPKPS